MLKFVLAHLAEASPPRAGLVNVSGDIREDKVRFAFELFDLDGSGFIDASELRKIVRATNLASEKQLDRKVRWLLSQCDKNGDGRIRCGFAAVFDCKPQLTIPILAATTSSRA
jgi:hypothetical protein